MPAARRGTSWDIVWRNVSLGRVPLTPDLPDATATYALAHNGAAIGVGALAWEAHGYDDAWVARIGLPATVGILVVTATGGATVDGTYATGSMQTSVEVV